MNLSPRVARLLHRPVTVASESRVHHNSYRDTKRDAYLDGPGQATDGMGSRVLALRTCPEVLLVWLMTG